MQFKDGRWQLFGDVISGELVSTGLPRPTRRPYAFDLFFFFFFFF